MAWLERLWYRRSPLGAVLYPFSLLFRAAVALRRGLYRAGILRTTRLPVPVIIAGNITAGGTGKTPLVLWLAHFLHEQGRHPGIISRGYGGSATTPQAVTAASDATVCGDEPVLLAQRGPAPVWIGADRVAAARALLAAHPECDVVISDDGLQHYALARDLEIAVIDGLRGLGNGLFLPAGPLREPSTRLATVDAIIVNVSQSPGVCRTGPRQTPNMNKSKERGENNAMPMTSVPMYGAKSGRLPWVGLTAEAPSAYAMSYSGSEFHNLFNPQHRAGPEHFHNRRVHAVAGIGNPQGFFRRLQRLGLTFTAHPFSDHHVFSAQDLAFTDADFVVMTEKDAVKCRSFATEAHWALRIDAEIDPAFGDMVLEKLGK